MSKFRKMISYSRLGNGPEETASLVTVDEDEKGRGVSVSSLNPELRESLLTDSDRKVGPPPAAAENKDAKSAAPQSLPQAQAQPPTQPPGQQASQGMPQAAAAQGLINCANCKCPLAYPQGAYSVLCPRCNTVTAAQDLSTMQCPICRQMLMYPRWASSVMCPCGSLITFASPFPMAPVSSFPDPVARYA